MFKLAFAIFFLIIAAMVAGIYFHFNPAIPVLIILDFGVYMVGRIGGPLLPAGTKGTFGWSGTGVYIESQDFVTPDPDSHSGGHFRDGVDPNDPSNKRS
jgi:hypothetical protein